MTLDKPLEPEDGIPIAATGIAEHHNPEILHEHKGMVERGKKWADCILYYKH